MGQFLVTGTVAANPNRVVAVARNTQQFLVVAQKLMDGSDAGKANAGLITLGHESAAGGKQPLTLNPGDERVFSSRAGFRYDTSTFYFNVANDGDGLVFIYE